MKGLVKSSVRMPQLISLEELVNTSISIYYLFSEMSEIMACQRPEEKAKKQTKHLHLRKHCHNNNNIECAFSRFSLSQLANQGARILVVHHHLTLSCCFKGDVKRLKAHSSASQCHLNCLYITLCLLLPSFNLSPRQLLLCMYQKVYLCSSR